MNIAERILELRKKAGISQEQLAEAVGVSRQAVSKWESGNALPDIDKIILLSDYFRVTTDYILKGIETSVPEQKHTGRINFPVIAAGFNYLGFILILFDAFTTWDIFAFAMTGGMIVPKIISIALMIAGTILFIQSPDRKNRDSVRKFLKVNTFAYAGIIPMIVYFLNLPYGWRLILYVAAVVIMEVVLFRSSHASSQNEKKKCTNQSGCDKL